MTCIRTPARTGGDGQRGPEQYGYPVRMAAGFVPPRGESPADYIRPIGTAPDDDSRAEPPTIPLSWAVGLAVLLLAIFVLLAGCQAVQAVAAIDTRPFPVPFNP